MVNFYFSYLYVCMHVVSSLFVWQLARVCRVVVYFAVVVHLFLQPNNYNHFRREPTELCLQIQPTPAHRCWCRQGEEYRVLVQCCSANSANKCAAKAASGGGVSNLQARAHLSNNDHWSQTTPDTALLQSTWRATTNCEHIYTHLYLNTKAGIHTDMCI